MLSKISNDARMKSHGKFSHRPMKGKEIKQDSFSTNETGYDQN